MKRLGMGLLCMCLAAAALAAGPDAVRKRAEASMLVSGMIEVAPDGGVQGYSLDQQNKLPPEVIGLIKKSIADWHFQPVLVDGQPALAKAKMSLRIVAHQLDDGSYAASIGSRYFGDRGPSEQTIMPKLRAPPKYPRDALQARVGGTVYLMLRIGRQGQVEDAVAQQVNLNVAASDGDMQRWRESLADAALKAAKRWTYAPPTAGKHVDDAHWVARVPVSFRINVLGSAREDTYGKWQLYIPGPLQPVPWQEARNLYAGDVDAVPGDGVYPLDQTLHFAAAPDHG